MTILNYYRGGTDRLTGFLFDTDRKTYRTFMLKAQDWAMEWKEGNKLYSGPKPGWKKPGDSHYWFLNLYQCNEKLHEIQSLGFTEDNTMPLDFGIFVL